MAAGSRRVARAWAAVGLRAGDGVVNDGRRAFDRASIQDVRDRRTLWTRIHAIAPKDRLRGGAAAGDADSGWRVELPPRVGNSFQRGSPSLRRLRASAAREPRLSTSTNEIRTNAAAHACSFSAGSGASAYWKIVSGIDATASRTSVETVVGATDVVKRSGAVSPAARATASVAPVAIPPTAVGRTTPRTVRQRLAPSAKLASRRWPGTSLSTSCVERATSGSMITASATDPASALWWWPTISSVKTKIPITIDGTPFSTSSASRTLRSIADGANSVT